MKRGNGKAVFTFSKEYLTGGAAAQAWFTTLKKADKVSFATARDAFKIHWPVKAITEKTTAEKQALLDEAILNSGGKVQS